MNLSDGIHSLRIEELKFTKKAKSLSGNMLNQKTTQQIFYQEEPVQKKYLHQKFGEKLELVN